MREDKVTDGLQEKAEIVLKSIPKNTKTLVTELKPLQAWILVDLLFWGFENMVDKANIYLVLLNAIVEKHGQGIICASISNRKPLVKVLGDEETN